MLDDNEGSYNPPSKYEKLMKKTQ